MKWRPSDNTMCCVAIGLCVGVTIDPLAQRLAVTLVLCLFFLVLMDIREHTR